MFCRGFGRQEWSLQFIIHHDTRNRPIPWVLYRITGLFEWTGWMLLIVGLDFFAKKHFNEFHMVTRRTKMGFEQLKDFR